MPKLFQASLKQAVYPIELFGGGTFRTTEENALAVRRAYRQGKPVFWSGYSLNPPQARPVKGEVDLLMEMRVGVADTPAARWDVLKSHLDWQGKSITSASVRLVPKRVDGESGLFTVQPPIIENADGSPNAASDREPYIRRAPDEPIYLAASAAPTFLTAVSIDTQQDATLGTEGLWNCTVNLKRWLDDEETEPAPALDTDQVGPDYLLGLQYFVGDADARFFNGEVRVKSVAVDGYSFDFDVWVTRLDPSASSSDETTPLYQLPATILLDGNTDPADDEDDPDNGLAPNQVVVHQEVIAHLGGVNGLTTECHFGAWDEGQMYLEYLGLAAYTDRTVGTLIGLKNGGKLYLKDRVGLYGGGERTIRADTTSKVKSNRSLISSGADGAMEAVVLQYRCNWGSTRDCIGMSKGRLMTFIDSKATIDQSFLSGGTEGVRVADGGTAVVQSTHMSHFGRCEYAVNGRIHNAGDTTIYTSYNPIDWKAGGFVHGVPTYINCNSTPISGVAESGGGLYADTNSDLRNPGRSVSVGQYGGCVEIPLLIGAGVLTIAGRTIHEANAEFDIDPFAPLDWAIRPRVATLGPLARFEHDTTLSRKTGDAVGYITYASRQRTVTMSGAHITRVNGVTTISGGAMDGHPFVKNEAATVAGSTVDASVRGSFRLIAVTADSISYEQPGEADILTPVGTSYTVTSWRLQIQSDRQYTHVFRLTARGDLDIGSAVSVTAAGTVASEPEPSRSPRKSGTQDWGEVIGTWDYSTPVSEVTFTDLSQFRELRLVVYDMQHNNGSNDHIGVQIGSAAGGVYESTGYAVIGNGTGITSSITLNNTAVANTSIFQAFLEFSEWNSSTERTIVGGVAGLSGGSGGARTGHRGVAEINDRLRLYCLNGGQISAGKVRIYGKRYH